MASKAIVGTKIGMTQVWDEENRLVPVTALAVEPCRVVQVKSPEIDGYSAVQVTWGEQKPHRLTSPEAGHFAKGAVAPGTKLVELRLDDVGDMSVGDEITAAIMVEGELVDVTAVSKGKGFAGAMKRHNFAGQRASHGAHRVHRKPGAIGQCATPSRVFKGKKMPGRMGAERVTTQNLKVVKADAGEGVILVKGSVPGPRGATVIIRNAVKSTPMEPVAAAAESGGDDA
jgi:large subunit ribosomal protein L3